MSRYEPPPVPPPAEAAARTRALRRRPRSRERRGAAAGDTDAAWDAAMVSGSGSESSRSVPRAVVGTEEAEEQKSVEGKKRERGVGPVAADVELSKWRRLWCVSRRPTCHHIQVKEALDHWNCPDGPGCLVLDDLFMVLLEADLCLLVFY